MLKSADSSETEDEFEDTTDQIPNPNDNSAPDERLVPNQSDTQPATASTAGQSGRQNSTATLEDQTANNQNDQENKAATDNQAAARTSEHTLGNNPGIRSTSTGKPNKRASKSTPAQLDPSATPFVSSD